MASGQSLRGPGLRAHPLGFTQGPQRENIISDSLGCGCAPTIHLCPQRAPRCSFTGKTLRGCEHVPQRPGRGSVSSPHSPLLPSPAPLAHAHGARVPVPRPPPAEPWRSQTHNNVLTGMEGDSEGYRKVRWKYGCENIKNRLIL